MLIVSQNSCDISNLVTALNRGKTIAYPTETCYGLGCDATNQEAVNKIYQIKGRKEDKPPIVLMSDSEMVKKYIAWSGILEDIARTYWPGALTVIMPAKTNSGLVSGIVASDGTIAVRVTAHPFAHALVAALGRPLVSTSANLAGEENLYDPKEVMAALAGRMVEPDIVIDGGVLPRALPTTVIRVSDNRIDVVRQGGLLIKV